MSIFKSKGFDTLIGKGTTVNGLLNISGTVQVDGVVNSDRIQPAPDQKQVRLHVNGGLDATEVEVFDFTLNGSADVETLRVEGTLAVKSGATLKAKTIYYRTLVVEPGCVMHGELRHLDHVSEGERV